MRSYTREEIEAMVASIGLPYAYWKFDNNTAQSPPFICWFFSEPRDVMADDENYVDRELLSIELYTKFRDFDQELAVEDVLKSYGFSYATEPNYIDSEKVWQIAYESEVIINVTEE